MSVHKLFCILMISAILSGCGFQPLYGPEESQKLGTEDQLSQIKIAPLKLREGQILHNHLLDRLNPQGEPLSPTAFLNVDLTIEKVATSLRRDGTTQRFNIVAKASFVLKGQDQKRILYKDSIKRIVAFSIGDITAEYGYASTVSEKDAKARALGLLADEIQMMVATYYKKWSKPQQDSPQAPPAS